ncbi:MAG: hypothetical protein ABI442_02195 [Gemmatimonadaceae bacterium]
MPAPSTGLRFPSSRVLLARTRLAYVHLPNLLSDAKRDRAARISGYVAISLPEELIVLYLLGGEVVNSTARDSRGARAIAIAAALAKVPDAPEYGEICFQEAEPELLACMFASESEPPESWPDPIVPSDPASLFPYLMGTMFDGVVEIISNDCANYLVFRNGSVARAYLSNAHHGTTVERVSKLFTHEAKNGDFRVARWDPPSPLAVQAPPALVQAYRDLTNSLIERLVGYGRDSAPAIAEHARTSLASSHFVLNGFSFSGRPVTDPLADTAALTAGVAAWIREVMWAAVDHDSVSPDALFRELTWDRRHMFQSAGLFDQLPWKVV